MPTKDRLNELLSRPSAFESALTWAGRPGYAVRDILTGNLEGAGRQLADIPLEAIDALLPGDLIPAISRPEDYAEGSDLVGGMEPGLKRTVADIGLGIATDPLTYLSFGASAPLKAGATSLARGARTALDAKFIPKGVPTAVDDLIYQTKRVAGALKPTDQIGSILTDAAKLESTTATPAMQYAVRELGADPKIMRVTHDILNDVMQTQAGQWEVLGVKGAKAGDKAAQMDLIDQRLMLAQAKYGLSADEAAKVRALADKSTDYTRGLYKQAVADKVLRPLDPGNPELIPLDYVPRKYDKDTFTPDMIKGRSLTDSQKYADFLNDLKVKGSDISVHTDLPTLLGEYGQGLGRHTKRAKIGNELTKLVGGKGPAELYTTDEGFSTGIKTLIDGLPDRADKELLEIAFTGMEKRNQFMELLAKSNSAFFKKFATAGAFIPRISFTTSNLIGGAYQTMANAEARGQLVPMLKQIVPTWLNSMGDGLRQLGVKWVPETRLTKIDDAVRASGGGRGAFISALEASDKGLADAVRHGVLDNNFVNSEQMVTELAKDGNWKSWRNWRDWPQAIARGSEQRMRLALFESLTGKGKSPADAARIVKDTMFDYDVQNKANRLARDIIPFWQFSAKAIPQTVQFILEKPVVAAALRPLYRHEEGPVYPYMEGGANIPLGVNETGERTYLSSLRMPFEAMNMIPNLSDSPFAALRQTKQSIVGSAHPILKTAIAGFGGEDPYFGTPFGSYDKPPELLQAIGAPEHGELGRLYNLAQGTGLIQPISTPIQTISGFMDERRSIPETLVSQLVGPRIIPVDESLALKQLAERRLREKPSIMQSRTFYEQQKTEEGQALLEELREARKKIKDKKAAAAVL